MKTSQQEEARVTLECRHCRHEFSCPERIVKKCKKNNWPMPNCLSCRKKRDTHYNFRTSLFQLRELIDQNGGLIPDCITVVMSKDQEFSAGVDRHMSLIYAKVLDVLSLAEKTEFLRPIQEAVEKKTEQAPRLDLEKLQGMRISEVRAVIVKEKIEFKSRLKAELVGAVLKHQTAKA